MKLFYEQILFHIHPIHWWRFVLIVIGSHNTIGSGLSLIMELPVPCACAKQSYTHCPRPGGHGFEVLEEMWSPPFEDLSPPVRLCANISTPRSGQTNFGPDPLRVTSVIDNSHRFLDHTTRNGKHGPMSGTGPSAGGRAATPPQTLNYTRGNKRKRKSNSLETCAEHQQDQHSWAAHRIGGPSLHSLSPK